MRASLVFCLGLVAALLGLELVLRTVPVSTATMTDYYQDPDLLTYPPRHRWRVSTGWDLRNPQSLQSNNWGFAAEHDFVVDPGAVALIGDSYVEASMLDAADRPAAQLEQLLNGRRKVYAMGSPGTALLDHAQRIRLASQRFDVRDMVLLLERFDARQSLCGSGNVVSRCLDPQTLAPRVQRQQPAGPLKRLARHSALAQYFGGQIRFDPMALWRAMITRRTPEDLRDGAAAGSAGTAPDPTRVEYARRMVDAAVDAFFAEAGPYLRGRLVVVVDGRRSGPAATPELIDLERTHLIASLRARGAVVHDLEPVYARHAASSRRSLDVGPYDGHLNPLGVRLAMQQAAAALAP